VISNATILTSFGYFVIEDFIDKETCEQIRSCANNSEHYKAKVIQSHGAVVDEHYRKTVVARNGGQSMSTVETKVRNLKPALERHFSIALAGCEPLQLLMYDKGDYFTIHEDYIYRAVKKRQVSVVLFLSRESDVVQEGCYLGGTLSLYEPVGTPSWGTCRLPVIGYEGLLVAFRSRTLHGVSPVIAGRRVTVVTWFN
jgi:SM-20-related protein